MSELVCLELSVLLWLAHILTQDGFAGFSLGLDFLTSSRDERRETDGVHYPRATRALANYVENLAPFVAVDLGLIVTHHDGGWGATVWIVARILYLPLYVAGATPWRSIVWVIALVGLMMMLARLAFGG